MEMMERREFLRKAAAAAGAAPVLALAEGLPVFAAEGSPAGDSLELPPENAEVFHTTCQYCMVQCGYKVHVWERGTGRRPEGVYTTALSGEWVSPSFVAPAEKGGKKVYIAVVPDKECVVNQGDHSVRGGTNAQTIFSEDLGTAQHRLRQPMIRRGGKGSPLEPVSWDEAVAFTAQKLQEIKSKHGADALGLVWGDWLYTLHTYAILKLWFEAIGSSSHAGNGWWFDEESAGISAALGSGTRSFTVQDFELTKLLVTAGTNLQANGSVWYHRFYLKNGNAKHIDIDPRRTHQSKLAEERGGLHLQIRPGTDAVLAAALMRLVLEKDAHDKDFVARHVSGFDVLKQVVMRDRFRVENAARETGVPADRIRQAADLLVANKGQTMMLSEKGIMHQLGAFEAQHGYAALGVILGNVGKPGACVSRAGGHPGGTFASPPEPASRKNNTHLYKALEKGKIQAIWAFASNIFKQMPSLTKYKPLMEKTFLVVQDRIETEMNAFADVVLPAATWGETEGILSSVDRRLRLLQKFMDPPGEAKPDWWIVAQVAKAMGAKGFGWQSPREIWDEVRAQNDWVKDITWDMLDQAGTNGVQWPYVNGKSVERLYSDEQEGIMGKRFFTDDGKIHVEKIKLLEKFNPDRNEWAEVSARHPLMAIDFRLNELWNTGYTYWDKPTVNERVPDAFLMIHPDDAGPRGITDGDPVKLRSPYGETGPVVAKVTTDIRAGVVGMPALFPKKGQEFNYVTRPDPSPINGDFVTMVAVEVAKA